MQEPLCRFCLELNTDQLNPLISPCPCRGSVQYIHRACLYRWMFMDLDDIKLSCSICKNPFLNTALPAFEVVPKKGTIIDTMLESSLSMLFAIHYILVFLLSKPYRGEDNFLSRYIFASQLALHVLYGSLFFLNANIKNWKEYVHISHISYGCILVYHSLSVYLMLHGFLVFTLPVGGSMNMYWITHKNALAKVNAGLIERFRAGTH